jgi:D-amino-acid dehydrogenase
MHVVVLGAGVLGVTTAYYLSEHGHDVTVVDSAGQVASGASGGNGGQLSYSFVDAMASPALLGKFPKIVSGLDPAFYVSPLINSQLVRWGLAFLGQCTNRKHAQNTRAVLNLALRSAALMEELRARTSLQFSFKRAGKLVMLEDPSAHAQAEQACALKREYGCNVRVITIEEAIAIEPALAHMNNDYSGAIYAESDEVGDSLAFTSELGKWLTRNHGTQFKLNTTVREIIARNGELTAIETDKGTLKPDAVIVCLGAYSDRFLTPLGIRSNIYPMRGYSVTLPKSARSNAVSISDLSNKMVFSRLDDRVRIAGFADFVGYRTQKDNQRVAKLLSIARKIAPDIGDYNASAVNQWGGFRPMTPNNQPLIGPTVVKGVHVNTGHGMLGWTLACVSGHDAAAGI